MSYLIGTGWWILWYLALWLAVTPFVVMTTALARATPNDPMPLILLALIVGFAFIFGAAYYAVTPKQPMPHRWAAQLLASALGLVLLSIHATWRFRYR